MYNNTGLTVLPATGMTLAVWYPLAGFALIAAGVALLRIARRKRQPPADG